MDQPTLERLPETLENRSEAHIKGDYALKFHGYECSGKRRGLRKLTLQDFTGDLVLMAI